MILKMWQEHLVTTDEDARINPGKISMKQYLLGHNLICKYGTVKSRTRIFKLDKNTILKWGNLSVEKIMSLAATKIVWPDEWKEIAVNDDVSIDAFGDTGDNDGSKTMFRLSIDGAQFRIEEPIDPDFRKNTKFYAFKFEKAGVNVEIGLDLFQDRIVWVNGPFPGSVHDLTMFRKEGGLKQKMEETGSIKAVGDKGYRGENALISVHNSLDSPQVREFKKRALARHETMNKRLKNFSCLGERFRHKFHNFKKFLLAVVVTVQFQFENGSPLFNSV